jgi:hypothetical protein
VQKVTIDDFLDSDEKNRKTEDEISEELKRYNSSKKPENILWELPLDRRHNLILQIRENEFLFFSLTRVSLDRDNKLIFHSVFLSQNQLKVLYEKIIIALDAFKKIQHERND